MQKPLILKGRVESEEDIEIAQWHKQEGDDFTADELLVEVISNKAVFEITPGETGKLISILHTEGEVVPLDEAIALIETTD